jgi:hypothetical protein
MQEEREAMLLRLPPALKEAMRVLARENKRSLTREVEVALERHVAPASRTPVHADE